MGQSKFVIFVGFSTVDQWVGREAYLGAKFVVCRWSSHSSSDVGIHCPVWHNPLHCGRAASADPWRRRADSAHVHIHVQLRQGQA